MKAPKAHWPENQKEVNVQHTELSSKGYSPIGGLPRSAAQGRMRVHEYEHSNPKFTGGIMEHMSGGASKYSGKKAQDVAPIPVKATKDRVLGKGAVGDDLMSQREEEQLNKARRGAKAESIEAYGTKGFKNTQWRKIFKNAAAMEKWLDENDASVQGTRSAAEDVASPGVLRGYQENIDRIKIDLANEAKEKFKSPKEVARLKSELAYYQGLIKQANDIAPIPVGKDATNPNPHPRVMTSAALPTPEDVQRVYGRKISPEEFKKTFGHDDAKGMTSTELRDEIRAVRALISGSAGINLSRSDPKRYEQLEKRLTELLDAASYRTKANDVRPVPVRGRDTTTQRWSSVRRSKDSAFKKLEGKLAHEKGVTDPAALAASIGRKKYGEEGMEARARAAKDATYRKNAKAKDVEGYMAGGKFHPVRGSKGYTKKAAGEARRKHNRRAHDEVTPVPVRRSA